MLVKELHREQMLPFSSTPPPCLIGWRLVEPLITGPARLQQWIMKSV